MGKYDAKYTLDPSFPSREANYDFKPDDTVYVPVLVKSGLFPDDINDLICPQAFKYVEWAKRHFWIRRPVKGDKTKIITMTVRDFLKGHDWQGMNPFETINKIEFLSRYRKKYPEL